MDNVDPAELEKFSAMSAEWWDPDGVCRPLHDLNPCRGEFVNRGSPLDGLRVLDVGCGGGILTEFLAQRGATALGIDANPDLISVARVHAGARYPSLSYEHTTVEALVDEEPGQFDVVTCMELLEHVPDPITLVDACAQCLRRGGSAYFSTINRTLRAYVTAILGAEYAMQLLPRGTHDYSQFIRPSELTRWARFAGLQSDSIRGMRYNPLTRGARLTRDLSVNYIAHFKATS